MAVVEVAMRLGMVVAPYAVNNPEMVVLPCTESVVPGVVVPMPTRPTESMRMRSFVVAVPPVANIIGPVADVFANTIPPVAPVPLRMTVEFGILMTLVFAVAELLYWRTVNPVLGPSSPTSIKEVIPLVSEDCIRRL